MINVNELQALENTALEDNKIMENITIINLTISQSLTQEQEERDTARLMEGPTLLTISDENAANPRKETKWGQPWRTG